MDDGRSCRIPVVKDADAWEWKINGVSEYECFEIRATAIPLALDGGLSQPKAEFTCYTYDMGTWKFII